MQADKTTVIKRFFADFNKITPAPRNITNLQSYTLGLLSNKILEDDCPIEFTHIFRKDSFQSRFALFYKGYSKLGSDRLCEIVRGFFECGAYIPQPIENKLLDRIFSNFAPPVIGGLETSVEYFKNKSTPKLYAYVMRDKKKSDAVKIIRSFSRSMNIKVNERLISNLKCPQIIGFNFYGKELFYMKIYDYFFNSSCDSMPKNVIYDKNKLRFIFSLIGKQKTDFLISYRLDPKFSLLAHNIQFPISLKSDAMLKLFNFFKLDKKRTGQIIKIVKSYRMTFTWVTLDNLGNVGVIYTPNYGARQQSGCLD